MPRRIRTTFRSFRYYLKGLHTRFTEENILLLSSGIAFNTILCLIPLLLVLTSALSIFLQSAAASQRTNEILAGIFPSQAYGKEIRTSVLKLVSDVVQYRRRFGLYGIGILLWTSASLFNSIRVALNRIYRLKTTKLMILSIVENILLVIVLGVLFLLANTFTWLIQLVESWAREVFPDQGTDFKMVSSSVSLVISYSMAFVIFFIVNRYIPDKRIPSRVAFVAALTTTSLWWIAGKGFGWYLLTFHPYGKVYGAYTFLFVFLVWIYYSSLVFNIGVIMGELYKERNRSANLPRT